MSDPILIREYQATDYEKVLDLFRMNTPGFFAPEEKDDLEHYLKNEIERYFVLTTNDLVIGSGGINYSADGKKGIISWDLMHPDHKGKGFGSLLLSYRIELLRNENIERIIVRTSQLVFAYYEKQGFQLVDLKKDYWAPGFDLYEMEYKIERSAF